MTTEELLRARIVTALDNDFGFDFSGHGNEAVAEVVIDAIRTQKLLVLDDQFSEILDIEDRDTFDGIPYIALTYEAPPDE